MNILNFNHNYNSNDRGTIFLEPLLEHFCFHWVNDKNIDSKSKYIQL